MVPGLGGGRLPELGAGERRTARHTLAAAALRSSYGRRLLLPANWAANQPFNGEEDMFLLTQAGPWAIVPGP